MCTFVRTHADTDTVDAPATSLTVYARMAYNDILSRRTGWPHLQVEYTLTTVAGTATYAFTSLSAPGIEQVTAIVDRGNSRSRLYYMTQTDADLYFPNDVRGTPTAYSIIGDGTIKLYPTPAAAGSYAVRGFRAETAWPVSAGAEPDLPRQFDEAICWFMLAQYFLAQEDPQLSGLYMAEYEQMVSRITNDQQSKHKKPRPNVMGGNNLNHGPSFMDRIRSFTE